jgi:hypothetical protein
LTQARCLVAAAVVAALCASSARADGDPASDVLPTASVYFPFDAPSAEARAALSSAVAAVYASGYRVKVAVIAAPEDLGTIPSLMNKPDEYAKFLGQELGLFYIGPLLIVMPHGFGVYDGGRSVAAEESVLSELSVSGSSVDDLVRSAATAVQRLHAADALKSADIRAPYVYPQSAPVRPGKTVVFPFRVIDDSDRAAVSAIVNVGSKPIASLHSPLAPTKYPNPRFVRWSVPKSVPTKRLRLCMTATDAAGNKSIRACVALKVAKT